MRSTLPTSHGFQPLPEILKGRKFVRPHQAGTNEFVSLFQYAGTVDFGPPLCIPAALDFRRTVCGGEDAIRNYCRNLAKEGEHRAARILGTEPVPITDNNRLSFANLRLPLTIASERDVATRSIPLDEVPLVLDWIMRHLHGDYNAFVNVHYISGSLWARFSAMIYLELEDFEYCVLTISS